MKNVSMVSFLMLLVVMLAAFARPVYADGWTTKSSVVALVVTVNGGVNVRLSPELSGCVSQSGYGSNYASIYPEHPGLSMMKADLLAAYMSGKKVQLYLWEGCKAVEMVLTD